MRKVCVVSGSRADLGLLRWLMRELRAAPDARLQIAITGQLLDPARRDETAELAADGFAVDAAVPSLVVGGDGASTARSMGLGLLGFADAFARLRPDIVVVLGDRFEILAAVQAAYAMRVPVAHLHGGEVTNGALDEGFRHAITKMSALHFPAARDYAERLRRMGEPAERIHLFGAIGVDAVRAAVERAPARNAARRPYALVTLHPETIGGPSPEALAAAVLGALEARADLDAVFTGVNSDQGGGLIAAAIAAYVAQAPGRARYVESLGQDGYIAAMIGAACVLGNSSSGLIEAPAVPIPTVNVGGRQDGRLKAPSVVDAAASVASVAAALARALDPAFRKALRAQDNPYGAGDVSARIARTLLSADLAALSRKVFADA
ncbi:MAG: UDP-N-acetylglucosamine 2-epimerase (hydrolyzing) [Azospirillum sp.]|nr:UDP-N-acetylglucosamine 2-epimerase (hydrolyzing) [Azospirillum sp.]